MSPRPAGRTIVGTNSVDVTSPSTITTRSPRHVVHADPMRTTLSIVSADVDQSI
jgi:hypothetical protein